ncbi:MAG: response regulator [Lachnospiraceae bacterium]|nr:response regulator [Lachnospiraceae bacterium]
MIYFGILYLCLALVSAVCIIIALREQRINIGYVVTTGLVVACDIVCFLILMGKGINQVRTTLTLFYLIQSWLYSGIVFTICDMGFRKYLKPIGIPTLILGLLQSALMISNLAGSRILSFSKHVWIGRSWWVAEDYHSYSVFVSFTSFRYLSYVSMVLIIILMLLCFRHADRVHRPKYAYMVIMQTLVCFLQSASVRGPWPVSVVCLLYSLICIAGLYYIVMYPRLALIDWSLNTFANEMSDGFILYDEHDDLIYTNAILRSTLSEELLKTFRDKPSLDEWVSHTTGVESLEVLPYREREKEIFFEIRKKELGEPDARLGTIYILHDATKAILEVRAMEHANAELERATRMKSDFLANMSHEIRTPMNAVIGMSQIALRDEIPEQTRDYLNQIQSAGRNLLNIINDILDFSKIESGKLELASEPYEPLVEMRDLADVLMMRIGEKPLELFVIAETQIPRRLEGDAMRIRQILINLAGNAIKFSERGVVVITVSTEQTGEDEILLTCHVRDTGMGIREEDLEKIFVSFQQVDSKRNRSVEGTGLGLAICRQLSELMGGHLDVRSEYGKGSDFWFSIPQKVLDAESDLVVKDAAHKHAFCCNSRRDMTGEFVKETQRLGVHGEVVDSPADYVPTGETDFLFFEDDLYDGVMKGFLNAHPDLTGVILVDFGSDFVSDRDNLLVMRRPETTFGMVNILNGNVMRRPKREEKIFAPDYTAPEARILIVDDTPINITVAEGFLKTIGAQCFSALSGKEAIEKVRQESFDIIFMDHMMPGMDGVEATRTILETIPSAAHTPIIALTANAMEDARVLFKQAGMKDFIAKPMDLAELIAVVKKWLPPERILENEVQEADET